MSNKEIDDKILKYESFLNDVLKERLKTVEKKLDYLNGEISEYNQLRSFIDVLKKEGQETPSSMKTWVDVGCSFFLQAKIENTQRMNVAIGGGIYLDLTLDEAIRFTQTRVKYLESQVEIYRNESASTKAHIKLMLLGLAELQKV